MKTTVWTLQEEVGRELPEIKEAARFLREGKLVAFPTETVYGLGADARSDQAVERIFQAKGRPSDNPLIVHISEIAQLEGLIADFPAKASELAALYWPGPLTMVLPVKAGAVSPLVTAGLSTVAVRMPDHPAALALIQEAGCPVAAPSANLSGRPSPTTARHVLEDLEGKIDGVLDGGPCGVGLESTVVEWSGDVLHILRPGGITQEQLSRHADQVLNAANLTARERKVQEQPRSPGMKYTHYAPRGKLVIVKGESQAEVIDYIQAQLDQAKKQGETTGVLTFQSDSRAFRADLVEACGTEGDLSLAASRLYGCLRSFDDLGVTRIWAESCTESGIGFALMNRLRKAAGDRIVEI